MANELRRGGLGGNCGVDSPIGLVDSSSRDTNSGIELELQSLRCRYLPCDSMLVVILSIFFCACLASLFLVYAFRRFKLTFHLNFSIFQFFNSPISLFRFQPNCFRSHNTNGTLFIADWFGASVVLNLINFHSTHKTQAKNWRKKNEEKKEQNEKINYVLIKIAHTFEMCASWACRFISSLTFIFSNK